MRFLFVDREQRSEGSVRFLPAQSHYLGRVLRLEAGDELVLVTRDATAVWGARLGAGKGGPSEATIVDERTVPPPAGRAVRLYLASLKSDRMEWALQKAVELGVDSFQPLATRHCVKVPGRSAQQRELSIAENACQQCGRYRLPELGGTATLDQALERTRSEGGRLVALHPDPAAPALRELDLGEAGPVALVIGPEGGLAAEELARLDSEGAARARFDGNILRAETAALAAATLVLARLGRL
ncbi:MAG: RsmE family RNA methyltransferase [Candidatus Wallbacteria bacterium]|nr:RsmE family RNA methyltransferase [Candidatus Wallbacteria bacterium]